MKDRITTMVEFFYNSTGYTNNIFDNEAKKNYSLYRGLYIPNEYGKFYSLFMIGYKDLLINDLSLGVNYLVNWTDFSSTLSLGFSYVPVDNVVASFTTYLNLGDENEEYTFNNMPISLNLTVEMRF